MFRKFALALTAAAALGATVSVPATADAKPWKKHHHWHHGHHGHHGHWGHFGPLVLGSAILGGAIYAGTCYQRRWVATPYGPRKVRVNVC